MEHSLINKEVKPMTREEKVQKLLKSIQTEEKAFHALSRYNVYDDLERWQAINDDLLQLYQMQYESLPEEIRSQQTSLPEMHLDFALTRDEVILEAAMDPVILNRFLTSWFPRYISGGEDSLQKVIQALRNLADLMKETGLMSQDHHVLVWKALDEFSQTQDDLEPSMTEEEADEDEELLRMMNF